MEKTDITIIGAGIIGLSAAFALSELKRNITVIDMEDSFGRATSSRNSEVIHAGLYYPAGSLKSETCIHGRDMLYELCRKNNIPHKKTGKILVACNDSEEKKLDEILENSVQCEITNLKRISKNDITKMEPDIKAKSGLFSPDTGIIDSHSFMKFLYTFCKQKNIDFAFNITLTGIEKTSQGYKLTVREPGAGSFEFISSTVINAAGLYSDKVAEFAGINTEKHSYNLHYCKGQYFRIRNPKKFPITHPVYPPPSETDLGIHITPDLAGGLRLGPDADYVDNIDYKVDENALEKFYSAVKRFLPSLEKSDLIPDTAGIRPKLQGKSDGFRDFVISEESDKGLANFINLIGIESPGLTAAPAIAEKVKDFCNSL